MAAELEPLATEEALSEWAFRAWPKLNTLRLEDADRLREAFDARLSVLRMSGQTSASAENRVDRAEPAEAQPVVLAIPKALRQRDREHLPLWPNSPVLFVAGNPATRTICASHNSAGWPKRSAMSSRCRCAGLITVNCTALQEVDWWSRMGIEPLNCARQLWLATHCEFYTIIGVDSQDAQRQCVLSNAAPIIVHHDFGTRLSCLKPDAEASGSLL
jgi:hypothetical protein